MVSDTANQPEATSDETDEDTDNSGNAEVQAEGKAVLHDRYEINHGKPLPHLNQGKIKSYQAQMIGDSHPMYFAMVCEPDYLPRTRDVEKFASLDNPAVARLARAGVVYWPPASAQRYVLVYENNIGEPIMSEWSSSGPGWKSDRVIKTLVKPAISLLMNLRDKGLTHRAINPLNVFDGGAGDEAERLILGDCLSCPPGFRQPTAFESIERAMADPIARGEGSIEDDLYALGVTITYLMRHNNPIVKMSDDAIIKSKIEIGSYGALTSGERFSGPILELLRGLLYDTPSQRLTLEEINGWLEGQRLLPRQPVMAKKANRPLPFDGKNYVRPVILARNLENNPSAATQIIENGDIHLWVSRSLEDEAMENRYDTLLQLAGTQGKGAGYWDRVLSYVAMALSPEAPIRYKGMDVCVDGLSYAMAKAFHDKEDLQPYHDLINHQFVSRWLSIQKEESSLDRSYIRKRYDLAKKSINQKNLGYGIERALYLVSPEAPCMSEYLQGYCVMGMRHLMDALEQLSKNPDRPELPIDRHIAAFISVRDPKAIDSFLLELNSRDYFKRILANLRILATIQKRLKLGAYPGIASWLLSVMGPVFDRYHDREHREVIKNQAAKIVSKGNLSEFSAYVDNDATWKNDLGSFKAAMEEYKNLRLEGVRVKQKLEHPEVFSKEIGQEIAAIASGILSGLIILAFAFIYMFK